MNKKKIKHEGLHKHRIKLVLNRQEKQFAILWKCWCEERRQLGHLLGDGMTPAKFTQRDAEVAATCIQWLGTPIGEDFLRQLGYIRQEPAKK